MPYYFNPEAGVKPPTLNFATVLLNAAGYFNRMSRQDPPQLTDGSGTIRIDSDTSRVPRQTEKDLWLGRLDGWSRLFYREGFTIAADTVNFARRSLDYPGLEPDNTYKLKVKDLPALNQYQNPKAPIYRIKEASLGMLNWLPVKLYGIVPIGGHAEAVARYQEQETEFRQFGNRLHQLESELGRREKSLLDEESQDYEDPSNVRRNVRPADLIRHPSARYIGYGGRENKIIYEQAVARETDKDSSPQEWSLDYLTGQVEEMRRMSHRVPNVFIHPQPKRDPLAILIDPAGDPQGQSELGYAAQTLHTIVDRNQPNSIGGLKRTVADLAEHTYSRLMSSAYSLDGGQKAVLRLMVADIYATWIGEALIAVHD